MGLLIALLCGAAGIALVTVPVMVPLWLRQRRILRNLSDDELAARVFRFEPQYFDYIGQGEPAVLEFRQLVDSRDVRGIAARWASLQRSFGRLERRVGHRGRPLILEYYCWYHLAYRELIRRLRRHSSAVA